MPHELARDLRGRLEMRLLIGHRAKRDRDRRQAEETALDGGRHGPRVEHVIPEIRAVVDAGNHHVVLVVEQSRDGEVHAVGRRTLDVIDSRLGLEHAQRHVEGQGVARAAAIAIRRYDGDLGEACQRILEGADTEGAVAIIVADENLHGPDMRYGKAYAPARARHYTGAN